MWKLDPDSSQPHRYAVFPKMAVAEAHRCFDEGEEAELWAANRKPLAPAGQGSVGLGTSGVFNTILCRPFLLLQTRRLKQRPPNLVEYRLACMYVTGSSSPELQIHQSRHTDTGWSRCDTESTIPRSFTHNRKAGQVSASCSSGGGLKEPKPIASLATDGPSLTGQQEQTAAAWGDEVSSFGGRMPPARVSQSQERTDTKPGSSQCSHLRLKAQAPRPVSNRSGRAH
ncbi:hypothetical protein CCMA1212_002648 [Trichoderma ghanense]|uniref:Uncharacterized protein n=1 Tax=Trichoderma ghanense TaxID=65468 RepID=A0ABY2HB26_9HYPO